MKKHLFFLLFTLYCVLVTFAQTKTVISTPLFTTKNQPMFENIAFPFNPNKKLTFFDIKLGNQTPNTIPIIDGSIAGVDVKAGLTTQLFFHSTMFFESKGWSLGTVDVNYNTRIKINLPADNSFNRGETVTLKAELENPNPASSLNTNFPSTGSVGLYWNNKFKALAQVDITDPINFSVPIINVDEDFDITFLEITLTSLKIMCFNSSCWKSFALAAPNFGNVNSPQCADANIPSDAINKISSAPSSACKNGGLKVDYGKDDNDNGTLEINEVDGTCYSCKKNGVDEINDNKAKIKAFSADFFSLEAKFPHVVTESKVANTCLEANGEDAYIVPDIELFKFLGAVLKVIPGLNVVGNILSNLSGSGDYGLSLGIASGKVEYDYDIITAGLQFPLTMKQDFEFCPTIYTIYKFPIPVEYSINSSSLGSKSKEIRVKDDATFRFKYPCNWEFLKVETEHEIGDEPSDPKNFSNHTYNTIGIDFYWQALFLSVKIKGSAGPLNGSIGPYTFGPVVGDVDQPTTIVEADPAFLNWYEKKWNLKGFKKVKGPTLTLRPKVYKATSSSAKEVFCTGDNTGGFTVSVTNGTPPYKYEWSNGQKITSGSKVQTNNKLNGGNQFVHIIDKNGCDLFASAYIKEPLEKLHIAQLQTTDALCFGASNGKATVVPTGGTPPYSNINFSGLIAGNHTATITDAKGCKTSQSYKIGQPDKITGKTVVDPVKCFGDNSGFAQLTPNGGTPPFSYSWSNGSFTDFADNLKAGTHSVTIKDANNCIGVHTFNVSQPSAPLNFMGVTKNVSCKGGADGSIGLTVTGGTKPYSYEWYNKLNVLYVGSDKSGFYGLKADKYTGLVTDKNGCKFAKEFTITEPEFAIKTEGSVPKNVSCFGGNDGAVNLLPFGGTKPYSFQWSNGANNEDPSGLVAGNYKVTITDAKSCKFYDSFNLTQPERALSINLEQLGVDCSGSGDGYAKVLAYGGTPPYKYEWSTGAKTDSVSKLIGGNYTVSITDSKDCKQFLNVIIDEPKDIRINAIVDSVTCYGFNNGVVTLEVTEGTPPYKVSFGDSTFSKFSNSNSFILKNLDQGRYKYSIVDANGCQKYDSVAVYQPDTLELKLDTFPALCYGSAEGKIISTVKGGTKPYTYLWSNEKTTPDIDNLTSEFYKLTVTDRNNCVIIGQAFISHPPQIEVEGSVTDVSCKDQKDGSIEIEVEGGVEDYSYLWSNLETTQNIYDLPGGMYYIDVTDSNNCVKRDTFYVNVTEIDCIDPPTAFTPDGDNYNDTWVLQNIELYPNASVQIFNKWGLLLYETKGNYEPWDGNFNGNQLPTATYYYIIDLNLGTAPYTGPVTIVRSNGK